MWYNILTFYSKQEGLKEESKIRFDGKNSLPNEIYIPEELFELLKFLMMEEL